MGKYDKLSKLNPSDQYLKVIVNELAEMNRLKRIELSHSTWENKHGVEFRFTESDNLEDGAL